MSEHQHTNGQHGAHGHEHGKLPEGVDPGGNKHSSLEETTQLVRMEELKFSFKKQKLLDEKGNPLKDEKGEEVKRPPIILNVPMPTWEGIVDSIQEEAVSEGEKIISFLTDLVGDAIRDQVRDQLSGDKPVLKPEELDLSKLTLLYIASMPKAERTGGGISKDTWSEWEKDYIEVMTEIRKSEEKATKAAKLMVGRFTAVRSDKKVLGFLREQLSIWAANSPNNEDFMDVYDYLDKKAVELMNKDSEELLAAL